MRSQKLHSIAITNRSFGKLSGAEIFLTHDLHESLSSEGGLDGLTLSSLEGGRALRGLKHLMERIRDKDESKLILTLGDTRKDGEQYFINFNEYRESTRGQFYRMYRTVGLEASLGFLVRHFPSEFKSESDHMTQVVIETVRKDLPSFLEKLGQTRSHQPELLDGTTTVLRGLSRQNRLLKKEVEALRRLQYQSNLVYYRNVIDELHDRLYSGKTYHEVQGKNSWQKWIYRNSWLFGPMYLQPIDRARVGFGDIPDFLFPTLDGFIDILEIKLPTVTPILRDRSRSNIYVWSQDVGRAIGQVVNYIHQMDLHQLDLAHLLNRTFAEQLHGPVTAVRPRAFILIGTENRWTDAHREAYRRLNYSLHGVEVITYNELFRRGRRLVDLYEDESHL